jgi:hypothetical protein
MATDQKLISIPKFKAALGQDHVYISASDDQRHCDSDVVVTIFILHLIAAAIKTAINEIAKAAGKDAWSKILGLFHKAETSDATEIKSQTRAVAITDEALVSLRQELSIHTKKEFMDATRKSLEQNLLAKHFPASKAKRIAKEFSNLIEERISHD